MCSDDLGCCDVMCSDESGFCDVMCSDESGCCDMMCSDESGFCDVLCVGGVFGEALNNFINPFRGLASAVKGSHLGCSFGGSFALRAPRKQLLPRQWQLLPAAVAAAAAAFVLSFFFL